MCLILRFGNILHTKGKIVFSPFALFALYAISATCSSVAVAFIEGRLFFKTTVTIKNSTIFINPLLSNLSTLIDFILLNPLTIFFLQSSYMAIKKVYIEMNQTDRIPPYHRYGLLVLSATLGTVIMVLYYQNFLMGDFFDAIIIPNNDGIPIITATGWVVFFWTAFFISFIIYRVADQFAYVIFIFSLSVKDISYKPFHQDESAGLKVLMQPSLFFFRAMVVLLIIFIVFTIQDKLLFDIDESNRLWGIIAYFSIAAPLFLFPLFQLHDLMLIWREKYLNVINQIMDPIIKEDILRTISAQKSEKLKEYLYLLESLEKYRSILCNFPIWPLPRRSLIEPISILTTALLPILHKIILLAAKHIVPVLL